MKPTKFLLLIALTLVCSHAHAQSTDCTYPIGYWVNNASIGGDTDNIPYLVHIEIFRETKPSSDYDNQKGCGSIAVNDNKLDKLVINGQLNYAGKSLKDNSGKNNYCFSVRLSDGRTEQIVFRKVLKTYKDDNGKTSLYSDLEVVSATGILKDHPALREPICRDPVWENYTDDPTHEAETNTALLKALQEADRKHIATPGFDNRQLFIASHTNLNTQKPYYATPKGSIAVNIRTYANTAATKIGELKPGTSMLVVDENKGWCELQLSDTQYGWVSLSTVKLSNTAANTPSAATTAATQTASTHVTFLGIPLNITPEEMLNRLKQKGFKIDPMFDDPQGPRAVMGMVNGVQSVVGIIPLTPGEGKPLSTELHVREKKSYSLQLAKQRFKKLVPMLESEYGKGKATATGEPNWLRHDIKVHEGTVILEMFNEDEMEGASRFYTISILYTDKSQL